jgi:hypothetical protein
MKQYRTLLVLVIILLIGWIFVTVETCAQVRLTSIEHCNTKWHIPTAKRVIPGQTGKYFQEYMPLSALLDSLGISGGGGSGTVTSITANSPLTGGTITASGSIGIQTASSTQSGAISSTDWNTFNNKISSYWTQSGTMITYNGPITVTGTANFNLHADNNVFNAHNSNKDIYACIDELENKIERQLSKFHDKKTAH